MSLKPRHKRRIFWGALSLFAAVALAVVLVPPFITLNNLKPKIENVILSQTGIDARIRGNVHFSLIGRATIVAHDIETARGTMDSVSFTIPMSKIFDLSSAPLTGKISVYGASMTIDSLTPPNVGNALEIHNSVINFKNKNYYILSARLDGGLMNGTVRTNQHKYDITSNGDEFQIKNHKNDLNISGHLYSDGSARGTMTIDTDDINEWFEFSEPKISQRVRLTMDFDWNGDYDFLFSNIRGDNFSGDVQLFGDGRRVINLTANDVRIDLTFLLNGTDLFHNTVLNIDLNGDLRFANRNYKHIKIDAVGAQDEIRINKIVADDMSINGGLINKDGVIAMPISTIFDKKPAFCLFYGNPTAWKCSDFVYDEMFGSLSVTGDTFEIFIQSDKEMPNNASAFDTAKLLGARGKINFQFSDVGGTIDIVKDRLTPSYTFAKNKTLKWLGTDIGFVPESMQNALGDFVWDSGGLTFTPDSGRWKLSFNRGTFYLNGENAKEWFPNIDLRSMNDLEYIVSGNYKNGNVSNLEIRIAGHTFHGSYADGTLTLKTDLLNMDAFVSQTFIDNYEEFQFLAQDPMILPFYLGTNVSVSADRLIHNGNEFANFVYSLKDERQTFSITDSKRGNLLATISKDQNKYNLVLQLNKFVIPGKLLNTALPINISDTSITGEAKLSTSGQIAYDIWRNLNGTLDMSFDGGILHGLGVDDFYANVGNITTLNAEYILSAALDSGASRIKKLRLTGYYNGGNFTSTEPFSLALHHADAAGMLSIMDGQVEMKVNMIMRGTSPDPSPIAITIMPDGTRNYSLSQIMMNFDPDFLRGFVATHDKF